MSDLMPVRLDGGDTPVDSKSISDRAKNALGERGPVWWSGAPDLNRHMARNTIYAVWFAGLS